MVSYIVYDPFRIALQVGLTMAALLTLSTPWMWPARSSAIYLHETAHALAAHSTGGQVEGISLDAVAAAGSCASKGGCRHLTPAVGHLGTAVIAAMLLVSSRWPFAGGVASMLVGALAAAALRFPLDDAARAHAWWVASASALTLLFVFACWPLAAVILRSVGTYWGVFVALDLFGEVFAPPTAGSDTLALAQAFGVDPRAVNILMLLVVSGIIAASARWSLRGNARGSPLFIFRPQPACRQAGTPNPALSWKELGWCVSLPT